MAEWNPEKYLLFARQRTQPAIDLAERVRNVAANSIADIGCGPGNSTAVLQSVFPNASVVGIDNSESMIKKAREDHGDLDFLVCSAEDLRGSYDLLFSNACLQWIPNHESLIPALMGKLNENGTLAVQIPMNQEEPLFSIIREAASDSRWNFENTHFEKSRVLTPEAYFDILSDCADSFDMWETVYYHPMPSHRHLIDWVSTTQLRPYLDVLGDDRKREFEREILRRTKAVYPFTKSGEVVLKFRRFFFIAHKD